LIALSLSVFQTSQLCLSHAVWTLLYCYTQRQGFTVLTVTTTNAHTPTHTHTTYIYTPRTFAHCQSSFFIIVALIRIGLNLY